MFRSLSSASKHVEEAPKTITSARSHSFDGLSSIATDKQTRPVVPPPTISLAPPTTSKYDAPRWIRTVPKIQADIHVCSIPWDSPIAHLAYHDYFPALWRSQLPHLGHDAYACVFPIVPTVQEGG
jgi:hypothetical protein